MSEIPPELLYTDEHEYLMPTDEAGVYVVGITDYAQHELGDIVYIELPDVGDRFARTEVFGTVEAVKAVSDLYCPVTGEVLAVNESLQNDPSLINSDPYGKGWMIRLRLARDSELQALLGPAEYGAHIGEPAE